MIIYLLPALLTRTYKATSSCKECQDMRALFQAPCITKKGNNSGFGRLAQALPSAESQRKQFKKALTFYLLKIDVVMPTEAHLVFQVSASRLNCFLSSPKSQGLPGPGNLSWNIAHMFRNYHRNPAPGTLPCPKWIFFSISE